MRRRFIATILFSAVLVPSAVGAVPADGTIVASHGSLPKMGQVATADVTRGRLITADPPSHAKVLQRLASGGLPKVSRVTGTGEIRFPRSLSLQAKQSSAAGVSGTVLSGHPMQKR